MRARVGMEVLVAGTGLALISCSACGSKAGSDDAGPHDPGDAGRLIDAASLCSPPSGPIPPTWTAEVLYDEPALGPERKGRSRGVVKLFVEGEDVLLFGDQNYSRLTLADGALLETVPYPELPNPADDDPVAIGSVARGTTNFGAVFGPPAVFCIVGLDGRFDLGGCAEPEYGFPAWPVWIGDRYQVVLAGSNSKIWTLDGGGTPISTRELGLSRLRAYEVIADVGAYVQETAASTCDHRVGVEHLDGAPLTPLTPITAPEYRPFLPPSIGASPNRALILHTGTCRSSLDECTSVSHNFDTFGTIVHASGQIDQTIAYPSGEFGLAGQIVAWDGESFVAMAFGYNAIVLYWIDEAGQLVGKLNLIGDPNDKEVALQLDGAPAIAVVAPREYLIGYAIIGVPPGTRLQRVRVSPP